MGTGSMNITEKVARAIHSNPDPIWTVVDWNAMHPEAQTLIIRQATAAITAFLKDIAEEGWHIVPVKPTEAMFKNAMWSFGGKGAKLMSRAIYEAMCDDAPKFEVDGK